MAKRKDEARVNLIVGAFVTTMFGLLVFSMFVIATSEGLLEAKADAYMVNDDDLLSDPGFGTWWGPRTKSFAGTVKNIICIYLAQ
mgnify:CR=1 FL=1